MKDGKYVILCVDDDPDILTFLRIVLESEGFAVAQASSAEDGLKLYDDVEPDAMIVDLMMEELDSGTNLVRDLQAKGNKVPIYMLSSTGDALNMATDVSSLGLAGVFQKPLSKERLIPILKSKLG